MTANIAAIVVNYRCAELTLRAAASFFAQCPDGHLAVVDNSEDPREAQTLERRLPGETQLVVNAVNTGFAGACNSAFDLCDHELVLLLNPDAQLLPDSLRILSTALLNNPQLGAVSPIQYWDQKRQWRLPPAWLPTGISEWSLLMASTKRRHAHRMTQGARALAQKIWCAPPGAIVPQRALSGGALLLRRSALEGEKSLFDPGYFMYFEDSDLCWRLRQKGWQLGMVCDAGVVHEWHHTNAKVQLMETSKDLYFRKHFHQKGQWEKRLGKLQACPLLDNPLSAQDLAWDTVALEVPDAWQAGWVLEVSPSPLLIPSIGHLGIGDHAQLDWHLFERIATPMLYLRLGPLQKEMGGERLHRVARPASH